MSHHLLGPAETAALLEVSRQRLHQIIGGHDDFPAPAAVLAIGQVWHTEDIKAWMAAHPARRPGRPRKTEGGTDRGQH